MSYMEKVPLDQLEPHPHNVRRDLGDLTELAESIKGMGLLEPLVIAPKGKPGEGFVVIGGHRRLAAAALAGLDAVPCIMRPDLNTQASQIEAMLVENLQRSDLTVMEEADAYAQLELLGATEVSIAKATGRARGTVRQRLLLASLPTQRREEFEGGRLSLDAAVRCAKLRERWADDDEILAMIDKAGTYSFGANYGVESQIQRLLEDRKRAAEPEPEEDDEPDGDSLDLDGRRASWEERNRLAEERNKSILTVAGKPQEWLRKRLKGDDDVEVRSGLIAWALHDVLDEYDVDTFLPWFGIDPPGDDEDVDDANLRIANEAMELTYADQVALLALAITGAAQTVAAWSWQRQIEHFVEHLDYEPSKAEAALLKGDDDEVA